MDPLFYIILLLPVIWFLIAYLSCECSGWKLLERRYLATYPYIGTYENPFIALIGIFKYGGILKIAYNREGLYLDTNFFYKPFHKPLFIPWDQISFSREIYFLIPYGVFTVNADKPIKIRLSEKLANKIVQAVYG